MMCIHFYQAKRDYVRDAHHSKVQVPHFDDVIYIALSYRAVHIFIHNINIPFVYTVYFGRHENIDRMNDDDD